MRFFSSLWQQLKTKKINQSTNSRHLSNHRRTKGHGSQQDLRVCGVLNNVKVQLNIVGLYGDRRELVSSSCRSRIVLMSTT